MYPESKKLMVLVFSTRVSFLLSNHLTRFWSEVAKTAGTYILTAKFWYFVYYVNNWLGR